MRNRAIAHSFATMIQYHGLVFVVEKNTIEKVTTWKMRKNSGGKIFPLRTAPPLFFIQCLIQNCLRAKTLAILLLFQSHTIFLYVLQSSLRQDAGR